MALRAKILGREKLKRRFARLPQSVRDQMATQFAGGAEDLVKMQRRLAPRKSGDLEESITWRWGFQGRIAFSTGGGSSLRGGGRGAGLLNIVVSAGNSKVRYAHIIEFGAAPHTAGGMFAGAQHPGTPAQPYFYPAYRAKKRSIKSRARRGFKKGIIASKGA